MVTGILIVIAIALSVLYHFWLKNDEQTRNKHRQKENTQTIWRQDQGQERP